MLLWDDGTMRFDTGTLSPAALRLCERPGRFDGCCQFTKLTYVYLYAGG